MWWRSSLLLLCILLLQACTIIVPKEEIYPFSEAEKIEIVSYPDRMNWDNHFDSTIVVSGEIRFSKSLIKERVVLNDTLTEKLFRYLFIEECPLIDITRSLCYQPRHAILFYNNESKIYSYLEVCLECGKAEGNFLYNEICDERTANLEHIFKQAGIKYFGEE